VQGPSFPAQTVQRESINSGINTYQGGVDHSFRPNRFSGHTVAPAEAAAQASTPTPFRNPVYPSERNSFVPYERLNHIHTSDPRTWTVADLCYWLQANNVPENIIYGFRNEQITGEALFLLSKEDLSIIGVQNLGQKVMLAKLIDDLKVKWMVTQDGIGSGSGHGGSSNIRMEVGEGVPVRAAPPLYQF
jgi:hypothetical protein